jgi:hypothetical protein
MATGGRQSRLERILKDLDAYSRDIESVQASFAENSRIGDDGFSSGISNILDHIESASDHIKQAYKCVTFLLQYHITVKVLTFIFSLLQKFCRPRLSAAGGYTLVGKY